MTRTHTMLRAALVLIVTLLAGCDNVDWGGIDLAVRPPPPAAGGADAPAEPGADDAAEGPAPLPEGRVLYYVRRADSASARATILPVAEITESGLEPIDPGAAPVNYGERFIAERLRRGAEFVLFHHGRRVGTFVARTARVPGAGVCPRLPRASGVLELRAGTEDTQEFLALAQPFSLEPSPPSVSLETTANMRAYGPIIAERILRARDAPLPGNWSRALRQLQPIPVGGAQPGFTATLLIDDALEVGFDDEGLSLFYIASPAPRIGFDTTYVQFTRYARAGKRAPRLVDFLDWDDERGVELLLEVYGTERSWFAVVGQRGGEWELLFRNRCESPASAAPQPADTAVVTGPPAADTITGSPAP